MPATVGQRVLERALQQYGEPELARRLGISRTILSAMLCGLKPVSDSILLKAMDLVMGEVGDAEPRL